MTDRDYSGKITIGIGEYRVSSTPMTTIGLGSCVALILHDESHSMGGMAHIMLPAANGRQDRPGKFADTAVKALIEDLKEQGCRNGNLVAKVIGGSTMFKDFSGSLNIGERNAEAVRTLMEKYHVRIQAEETGGTFGRSLVYYPAEKGRVTVSRADGKCVDI